MKVYLFGASNPEIFRIISAVKRYNINMDFIGFLDNDAAKRGKMFYHLPVLGGAELIPELLGQDVFFVNLITRDTLTRHAVTKQIIEYGGALTNLIHPSVDLTMTAWGVGNYVQENAIIQAAVTVGNNTSVNMHTTIGHETSIGNSVFIAHDVSIAGQCAIGDGVFIGANATILPRLTIGKWSIIGAGAVVTKDVADFSVVVGNPARFMKQNIINEPSQLFN